MQTWPDTDTEQHSGPDSQLPDWLATTQELSVTSSTPLSS
jgi:hypothetical protein